MSCLSWVLSTFTLVFLGWVRVTTLSVLLVESISSCLEKNEAKKRQPKQFSGFLLEFQPILPKQLQGVQKLKTSQSPLPGRIRNFQLNNPQDFTIKLRKLTIQSCSVANKRSQTFSLRVRKPINFQKMCFSISL